MYVTFLPPRPIKLVEGNCMTTLLNAICWRLCNLRAASADYKVMRHGTSDDLGGDRKTFYRIGIALAVLALLVALAIVVFAAETGSGSDPHTFRAVLMLVPMPQTLSEYTRLARGLKVRWSSIVSFCRALSLK